MMSTLQVLAKAGPLIHKVIAVTNGTSPLGNLICQQAAQAGATVYSVDSNPEALARQGISFRQNQLRLRGVPCDMSDGQSLQNAVQEIVSHAPPIDLWIHAAQLTDVNNFELKNGVTTFGNHFLHRGKGQLLLFWNNPTAEVASAQLSEKLEEWTSSQLTQITGVYNITTQSDLGKVEVSDILQQLDFLLVGIRWHAIAAN